MSCITENENFRAVCANPAVIETAFNQYLENEGPIDDEPLEVKGGWQAKHDSRCFVMW